MTSSKPKTKARRSGKPHNARTIEYASFNELLAMIAAERRTARIGLKQVTMSRSDRLLRLMLDRALQGKEREVKILLKLMAKIPALGATYRDEMVTVICGALATI